MKCDILLAGVGGQGVLTAAALIAGAAVQEGLWVKQSEVHGMAQRGGSVSAHLRISDEPIFSDLIPRGMAKLLIAAEPLEALRYLDYLAQDGALVSASEPLHNIPTYPEQAELLAHIRSLGRALVVDAEKLAHQAGLPQAQAIVLVGAATAFLPLRPAAIEEQIRRAFQAKPKHVVDANLLAFHAGLRASVEAHIPSEGGAPCL